MSLCKIVKYRTVSEPVMFTYCGTRYEPGNKKVFEQLPPGAPKDRVTCAACILMMFVKDSAGENNA